MTPLDKLVALAPAIGAMRHPSARDMQQKLNDVIAELRREYPETGVRAAWAAVVDTLYAVRPDWDETAGKSSMDNAVAAIRSMGAQCRAQPATDECSMGVPPLRQAQLGALSYAIGYLEARDRGAAALELSTLHAWLVANAPRT